MLSQWNHPSLTNCICLKRLRVLPRLLLFTLAENQGSPIDHSIAGHFIEHSVCIIYAPDHQLHAGESYLSMYNGLKVESCDKCVGLCSFHWGWWFGLCYGNTKKHVALNGGRFSSLQMPKLLKGLLGGQPISLPLEVVSAKPTLYHGKMEARYMWHNN